MGLTLLRGHLLALAGFLSNNGLLLEDNSSFLLMEDNVSILELE